MKKRIISSVLALSIILTMLSSLYFVKVETRGLNTLNGDKMIKLSGTANVSGHKYIYAKISDLNYLFKEGDYIEYQVKAEGAYIGFGAVELELNAVPAGTMPYVRDDADWNDQNSYRGHPNENISLEINKKWYTRKLIIPQRLIGITAKSFSVAFETLSVYSAYTIYYDNLVIRDKYGKIATKIFVNSEQINFNIDMNVGNNTMNYEVVDRDDAAYFESIKTIESTFGRIEVDTKSPSIIDMWLREPDGNLSTRSILNSKALNISSGFSYVEGEDGKQYSSKNSKIHSTEVLTLNGVAYGIKFTGVELLSDDGQKAPITQDWTICADENGNLDWNVKNTWTANFKAIKSGMPALFLGEFGGYGTNITKDDNCVTTGLWYEPSKIHSEYNEFYNYGMTVIEANKVFMQEDNCLTITDKDAWTVLKLYSNFFLKSDIKMSVNGGYLFRRGASHASFSEIGSSIESRMGLNAISGQVDDITLTIEAIDNAKTGNQLEFDLPDSEKQTEDLAKLFFGTLENGGVLANNKLYNFGNASDGCVYSGMAWAHSYNLASSMPQEAKSGTDPYILAQAYKRYLSNIFATARPKDGLTVYGYNGFSNAQGTMIDENLVSIIGAGNYYLLTEDMSFIQDNIIKMEKILEYFIANIQVNGLFKSPGVGAHWYYDIMRYSGYNTYINTILYKSLDTVSELYYALGNNTKGDSFKNLAIGVKNAINNVLWNENAPNGARYSDWMEENGTRHEYFVDLVQYPAVVYGVASTEQAKKIMATADRRIAELVRDDGYVEWTSPTNLWPIVNADGSNNSDVNFLNCQWGTYMNGGSILAITYYEIVARAMAGDGDVAYYRYQKFLEGLNQTRYCGTNNTTMQGVVSSGGEAYLGDMVTVMSSMVTGILGINQDFDGLKINPSIPSNWIGIVSTNIVYKGIEYTVSINCDDKDANGSLNTSAITTTKKNRVYDYTNKWLVESYPLPEGISLEKDGLLALWKMNNPNKGVPNEVDDLAPAYYYLQKAVNDGAVSTIKYNQSGKFEKAIQLTGENLSFLRVNNRYDFYKNDSFTLSAWAKTDSSKSTGTMALVSKQDEYVMALEDGVPKIGFIDSDFGTQNYLNYSFIKGTQRIDDNAWHNVTAVFDRNINKAILYVDGIEVARGDIPDKAQFYGANGLTIGAHSFAGGWQYKGYIDDVSIFNKALTVQEINFSGNSIVNGLTQKDFVYKTTTTRTFTKSFENAHQLEQIKVNTILNNGSIVLKISSIDSIGGTKEITHNLVDGLNVMDLSTLSKGYTFTVDFIITGISTITPIVSNFEVSYNPDKYAISNVSDINSSNLVSQATPFVSSEYSDFHSGSRLTDGIVDGTDAVVWSNNIYDNNPQILFDMKAVKSFKNIEIYYDYIGNTYGANPKSINIYTSYDGDNYSLIKELTVNKPYGTVKTDVIDRINFIEYQNARFIKITFPQGGSFNLAPNLVQLREIKIGNFPKLNDLTASGEYVGWGSGFLYDNVNVDGTQYPFWQAPANTENTISFSFDETIDFNEIKLAFAGYSNLFYKPMASFDILVSADGVNYSFVKSFDTSNISHGAAYINDYFIYKLNESKNTKFVKLVLKSPITNICALSEIKFAYSKFEMVEAVAKDPTPIKNISTTIPVCNYANVETTVVSNIYTQPYLELNNTSNNFSEFVKLDVNEKDLIVSGNVEVYKAGEIIAYKTIAFDNNEILFSGLENGNYRLKMNAYTHNGYLELENDFLFNLNVSNDIVISNCDSVSGWFGQLGNGADRTVDTTDKAEGTGSIKYVAEIGWGVAMKYISATPVDISTKSYIEFDLFVEDGKSIFNEATLAGIDLTSGGNPDVEAVAYNANFVKSLSLNNGWTHVVLKLSDAVARTDTGTFKANEFDTFRFYLFGTTAGKQYVTKIDNLRATNGSRTTAVSTDAKKVLDNCDSIVGWETLGTIPTVDRVTKTEGTGSYNIRTRGNAFNVVYRPSSAVNGQKMESLSFDLYTSDANIFKDSTTTGIEITSSGASDNSELEWLKGVLASLTIIPDQWNTITLSASSASPTGVIDISNINYFRLYVVNSTAKVIDVKIDNLNLNLDIVAPAVTGVIEGSSNVGETTITFDSGTATLNGNAFANGSKVMATGQYTLVVADAVNNSTTVNFDVVIYGDVNGDGQIDVLDLAKIKKNILHMEYLTGPYLKAGKINNSAQVTISDLLSVKKHILGLINLKVG